MLNSETESTTLLARACGTDSTMRIEKSMVKRRTFLTGLGSAAAAAAAPMPSEAAHAVPKSTSGLPPRKVIVGTVVQPFWVPYPGLAKRLDQLANIVERMAQASKERY